MKLKKTSAVEKLNTCYIIEIIDITIEQLHLSLFFISIDNDRTIITYFERRSIDVFISIGE